MNSKPRILLDIGSQVIDFTNLDLAQMRFNEVRNIVLVFLWLLKFREDDAPTLEMHYASVDEEQERELAPEAEQGCQVEKLPQGLWPKDPFLSAFKTLKSTSAAQQFDVSEFSSTILVTRDFAVTVNKSFNPGMYSDPF
ncbi:hypothetical protein BS50DRAFT_632633 [Corynespora cassiicola Philippines]|uniref:Uncharacterized protein n=1 Tax=Corynespora cassiicola Philippines TaxID=1448308 RepID=A0A2T2NTM6_CORCC|nr:hypothetical protein BS50DRAFT_632633 [Corynespora cassiicola Philippines]